MWGKLVFYLAVGEDVGHDGAGGGEPHRAVLVEVRHERLEVVLGERAIFF